MSHPLGTRVAGRYRITGTVGSGGVGTVYRAVQEPLDRDVALKMLLPAYSKDVHFRRRFAREARAVATLSHPHIAAVHDFGLTEDDQLYLAMEYVEGHTLETLCDGLVLPFPRLHMIFDQLLAGLAHAHARGVVHRDVKPANILVAQDVDATPVVKLVDFGIARVQGMDWGSDDKAITAGGRVVGTPHYMAPEQARGTQTLTPAVDIYAVGLALYWAVTGRHAFDGETPMDIISAQVYQPPPAVVPRPGLVLPDRIEAIIHHALAKQPADRIPHATEFRRMLQDAARQPVAQQPSPPPPAATIVAPRPRRPTGALPSVDRAPAIPLVGRMKERDALNRTLDAVRADGMGRIVTLEGGPGVGKSTLARAWREEIVEEGVFRSVTGNFHREGDRGMRGFREVFESLLGTRGLPEHHAVNKVTQALSKWGLTDTNDAQLLLSFLRPTLRDSGETLGGPEALFEVLLRVLERLAQERPIFLVVRDLHWAGPEAAAFMQFLATELLHRPCPMILVVTTRETENIHPSVASALKHIGQYQGQSVRRVHLTDLAPSEARELVMTLVNASAGLVGAITERAGGNPMHIVQLTRYLFERGLIAPGPNGWEPKPGVVVAEVLPPTLADLVRLRIEQLGEQSEGRIHDLLDRAAIAGRRFRFAILERMLEMERRHDLLEHLDEDIDKVLDEDILRLTEKREDDILAFRTSLVRDVISERLRGRRRTRKLHRLAADAKIAVWGADAPKFAGELSDHYRQARDPVREYEYVCVAIDNAERTHRYADATSFIDRAVRLLEEEDRLEVDDPDAIALELRLRAASMHTNAGDYDKALGFFTAVASAAEVTPGQRLNALYGSGYVGVMRGSFAAAGRRYEEGTGIARSLDDDGAISRGLLGQARVAWHRGDPARAQTLCAEALVFARRASQPTQVADVLWLMGVLANGRGDLEDALHLFADALRIYEDAHHNGGVAKCKSFMAANARLRADLTEAAALYNEALEIYTAMGARRGVAHQFNGLGDIARFQHDYDTARAHYRRAVEIFQAIGVPFDAAIALTNLGLVAREAGDLHAAEDAFRRALRVSERVEYPFLVLGSKLNLAWVLAAEGVEEESNMLLRESLDMADRLMLVDPDYAVPLERLAELKNAAGKADEARELYGRALHMWREMGRQDDMRRLAAQLNVLG